MSYFTVFFAVVARTSFTPRLEFLAEEARNDALENDERGVVTQTLKFGRLAGAAAPRQLLIGKSAPHGCIEFF